MIQVRDLGWGCAAALLLSACATTPPAADSSAEPPAQPAASQVAAAVTDSQPQEADGTGNGDSGPPPGWRVIQSKGETLWCSPRPPTGTRLTAKASCVTPDEYHAAKTEGKEWLRESIRRSIETKPAG